MAKIMIADDNPRIRKLFATIVKYAGYEVVEASSREEITDFFSSDTNSIDLLVIDREFDTEDDGVDISKTLRDEGKTFPIILCSAHTARSIDERIINKVLEKPVTYNDLIETIGKLLSKEE